VEREGSGKSYDLRRWMTMMHLPSVAERERMRLECDVAVSYSKEVALQRR